MRLLKLVPDDTNIHFLKWRVPFYIVSLLLIAAALLFYFGSGPVRGFAIVLVIGIVTSVFTAVVLTRMWVAGYLRRNRPSELNI